MVLCDFYPQLESCPLPFPLPLPKRAGFAPGQPALMGRGKGGMGGGIALPLAKVENMANNTKCQNKCTEFALSTDTTISAKKFRMSVAMEVIQYCVNSGGSNVSVLEQYWCQLGAVLYQYWSSTGVKNVSALDQKCISSVSVVYQ